jgi:hypothetical protein
MYRQHKKYSRIHVDGFAEGPVPEEVYREVMGPSGRGFLRAGQYEREVFRLVDKIDASQAGRLILGHLESAGGSNGIVVLPASLYPPVDGKNRNATWPTRLADAYAGGGRLEDSKRRGTGRGSPVKISFELHEPSACLFGGPSEAVLLHELVHAIRATTGSQVFLSMRSFDRFEEFVAVTLANVYLSEVGLPLREGHGCDRMLEHLDSFRTVHRDSLERLRQDSTNAGLYRRLGDLPESSVRWNPFRGWP